MPTNPMNDLQVPAQPNVAGGVMSALQTRNMLQSLSTEGTGANQAQMGNAAANMLGAQTESNESRRKASIEMNEFALNVLSGVNSQEDLNMATRIFAGRYPAQAKLINIMFPGGTYNPQGVKMLKEALLDTTEKLKQQELDTSQYNAETARMEAEKPILSPGQQISDRSTGEPVGEQVPFKPAAPEGFELFQNDSGEQMYVQEGTTNIPSGYTRVETGEGSVNVEVNTGDLTKPAQTQLQKDIVQGVQNIASFRKTADLFQDEYLTYLGKADKWIAEKMDKAGIATEDQKALITEYNGWFRQAKADFIAYRKWATGVAGGEKELVEIATSFPDPVKNSPTQYRANIQNIEKTTRDVLTMNAAFLESGIDTNQPLQAIFAEIKEKGVDIPDMPTSSGGGLEPMKFDSEGNLIP